MKKILIGIAGVCVASVLFWASNGIDTKSSDCVVNAAIAAETTSGGAIAVEPLEAKFSKKVVKLYPGKSYTNKLKITGNYESVSYKISNKSYGFVNKNGKVTLKKAGAGKNIEVAATILYERNDELLQKVVTYMIKGQKYVTSIKLSAKNNYVFVGKRMVLKAQCKPASASNKNVVWSSSNKKYATITSKGKIIPRKAGAGKTVVFTAKAKDGSGIKKIISVRVIDLKKPMVALTFDDGPSYEYTSRIMKQLKKYDGRATFFVLGSKLGNKKIKALVKKSSKYGNEIASHTYNHKNLSTISSSEVAWESTATNKAIEKVTGKAPKLTRPPYGSVNATVKSTIKTPLIMWSIDTRDWETRNASKTIASVMNNVKDGDIVLMHDIYDPTADAAENVIARLTKKGYQLVTVSEMAAYKKKRLKDGKTYSAIR